jgi:hypothetical protein
MAAPYDFDKNEIQFSKPKDNARATFKFNDPSKKMLDNGYSLNDLSYMITSKVNSGKIDDGWGSCRVFKLTEAATLTVQIVGNTDITLTGGSVTGGLSVSGDIYGGKAICSATSVGGTVEGGVALEPQGDIEFNPKEPDKKYPKTWDMTSDPIKLNAGSYVLAMQSGAIFRPSAVGDVLTISSSYQVDVNVVNMPEPGTWALLLLGVSGVGFRQLIGKHERSAFSDCCRLRAGGCSARTWRLNDPEISQSRAL